MARLPFEPQIVRRNGVKHHLPRCRVMCYIPVSRRPCAAHVAVLEGDTHTLVSSAFCKGCPDFLKSRNAFVNALEWSKNETQNEWADLSDGCYILRTNVTGWTAEELWQAYIQLMQAEQAFRIHKSDLDIRPIWHQTSKRVQAHILVCFLAYVLWKTLEQLCRRAGLGDEPRRGAKKAY